MRVRTAARHEGVSAVLLHRSWRSPSQNAHREHGCWVCGMHCWHTRASVWIATSFRLRPRAGHQSLPPETHAGTPREREIQRDFERERELIATHTQDLATGVGVGVCVYLCVCVCVRVRVCVCVCVCILCVHVCVTAVTYAAHHTSA